MVCIVLDDTGFSHLGCYGSLVETPSFDRLAGAGVRFNNFHTTSLCSPSRACLLTGMNHHTVGMRALAGWDTGEANCRGYIDESVPTLADILRAQGYGTYAVGKWHLIPARHSSPVGPFTHWPLGRGFDRFYGFLGGETSQFFPELYSDNHWVPVPGAPEDGYHLSSDLVDRAIGMVREHVSFSSERPFFLYLALAATHSPHQAPKEYIERYRGAFDMGWDEARQRILARQLAMGVVPPGTALAPRNPDVRAWAELSAEEQAVASRLQEAFAGYLTHADAQIGRLLDVLAELGVMEETLAIALSDNGASAEGGPTGVFTSVRTFNSRPERLSDMVARLDEVGSYATTNNYPTGWAMAGNTPLKLYKQHSHGGGVRDPLIVAWPNATAARGSILPQFHHMNDIAPTILDLCGVGDTEHLRRMHGISMRYCLEEPAARSRKVAQYFEIFGHRGLWHEGWKAVVRHVKGKAFEDDAWELYHLEEDFSEANDLALEEPEMLERLRRRWGQEARTYGVFPLDDRTWELFDPSQNKALSSLGPTFVWYPPVSHVNSSAAPPLGGRSFTVRARSERTGGPLQGVILAYGSGACGFSLFVRDRALIFDYNLYGEHAVIASTSFDPERSATDIECRFVVERAARTAEVALLQDGVVVGTGRTPDVLMMVSPQGVDVGADRGYPVSELYDAPFAFSGDLRRVEVIVEESLQDEEKLQKLAVSEAFRAE